MFYTCLTFSLLIQNNSVQRKGTNGIKLIILSLFSWQSLVVLFKNFSFLYSIPVYVQGSMILNWRRLIVPLKRCLISKKYFIIIPWGGGGGERIICWRMGRYLSNQPPQLVRFPLGIFILRYTRSLTIHHTLHFPLRRIRSSYRPPPPCTPTISHYKKTVVHFSYTHQQHFWEDIKSSLSTFKGIKTSW